MLICMSRTFVIGDVHGCHDELKELYSKLNFNSQTDKIILTGDLVDRGPQSKAVVSWCRFMKNRHPNSFFVVQGNHDEVYPRYQKGLERKQKDPKFHMNLHLNEHKTKVFESLNEEDIHFLKMLPSYYIVSSDWVVVHAGFEPSIPLEKQDYGKMQHIRYLDKDTNKTLSLGKDFKQPDNSVYWTEKYNLPYNVVYGHMVHSRKTPKISFGVDGQKCVGVDTGGCFGHMLSAYVIETGEVIQVKAKEAYVQMHGSLANIED